jgi:hypothetical protein
MFGGFRTRHVARNVARAGRARAWVRLCLEKKLLGQALETLLEDGRLVHQTYKDYACIAHPDCR